MPLRELLLVRHGESMGNVAREQAEGTDALTVDIDRRDADVALSELGRRQAAALGERIAGLPGDRRPDAVWTSPYARAVETQAIALEAAGLSLPVQVDERLRDRELGILDRLTGRGVAQRHPDEAARRRHLGKMYYRPPGGESWADVALRLRSVLRDMGATGMSHGARDGGGPERLLVTCHDAVILLIRYVLEPLDERTVLEIAARDSVRNASVTTLVRDGDGWRPTEVDDVGHLEAAGVASTEHGSATPARPRPVAPAHTHGVDGHGVDGQEAARG